jgi:anthranilate phosphoribosyltransferase
VEVRGGATRRWTIDPAAYDLRCPDPGDLRGGGPAENARIVTEVLAGGGAPGARAAVVLNAAAAVYVAGHVPDFGAAVDLTRAALAAGKGLDALERLRAAYA